MAPSPTSVNIPKGLTGSTVDRIAKLARLITAGVDQPYAARMTNKVLPGQLEDRRRKPMPLDELSTGSSAPESLRG